MNTKDLTKAALLAALIALFSLAFVYLPVGSLLGMFFGVCAVSVLIGNVSPKYSVLALLCSVLLTALLSDVFSAVYYCAVMTALPGAVIGICLRNKQKLSEAWLFCSAAYLAAILCGFFLLKQFFGVDFMQEFRDLLTRFFTSFTAAVESVPELADSEQAALFLQSVPTLTDSLLVMIPSALISFSAILALCSLLLSRSVVRRLGQPCEQLAPFSRMIAPKALSVGYLVLMIVPLFLNNMSLSMLCSNLSAILSVLLLLYGMSLLKYALNRTGVPKGIALVLLLIAVPLVLLLSQFVVFAAVADSWWDFRRLRAAKE